MPLTPGTKLGRYEILSQLGAGGMGEVYRARDPQMNRDVAIKILPDEFSTNAERLHRFELEVQATGKLNHPNILVVYNVESLNGTPYVVCELLEGETLRERLRAGPLASRKALEYALQIANGLAAAHAKGVVHRDLKPDNIFITDAGFVKILDFGLAKLVTPLGDPEDQTDVATRKVQTDPGAVMGTVGYMAPEQVHGRSVDHRADIFSFGAVFYEMLSGRRAFHGDSAIETLNAILKQDPEDLTSTNPNIAPALERVVLHCLEKKPERRFQSANDVAFALDSLSSVSSLSSQQRTVTDSVGPARSWSRERIIWLAACVVLLGIAAALAFSLFRRPEAKTHAVELAISVPQKLTRPANVTISPDGLHVAFVATDVKREIWLRSLDGSNAQPLTGTDDAGSPFWSPDSHYLGYFANGKLYKIDIGGGRPQQLCETAEMSGGTWNRDGVILFGGPQGLSRISAQGGTPVLITKVDATEEAHRWPYFLPDGRHFLFLGDAGSTENHHIRVGSLDSQQSQNLFSAITRVAYAPPGYLLYISQGALVAQPFDADKLRLSGDATVLAESIAVAGDNHEFDFSVSETGVLAYQTSSRKTQLTWLDRSGKSVGKIGEPDAIFSLSLAPDGKRALITLLDADGRPSDIWMVDLARGTRSRLTFDPLSDSEGIWSPNGQQIVFSSNRSGNGHTNLFMTSPNASGNDQKLELLDADEIPTSWSADGQSILTTRWVNGRANIWQRRPEAGEGKPVLQSNAFDQVGGVFAPNGRFFAYMSNESGRYDAYVQTFPPSGPKWSISLGGGGFPIWRNDGREMFYFALDGTLMSVDVKMDGTFESGTPKQLFKTSVQPTSGMPYAVNADGTRFLMNAPAEESSAPLIVVLNWTARLKQNQ